MPQLRYTWSQISTALHRTADETEGLVQETAKKATFQVTVVEKGTIDSMKNAVLSSKVEGSTTIITIVPEGSTVKTGDLVCELDASLLNDKETQQEIAVEKAKAALEQGREDLKIQEAQNESDIEAAKLKFKLAEIDLIKFREGDLVQQKNDLDSKIKLAEQTLARAQESYQYVLNLTKKGYRTQNDLEAERIAVETEKINLELVRGDKRVLTNFTEGRTFAELDANVKEYGREIQRTESKTRAALTQKKAELKALELTFEVESKKYERLLAQISACKIYATQDGQVVYANTRDGRATDQVQIDVGVAVRERQAIINLPDLDQMKVNARIHESRISMVTQGMTALIKVDAFPDQTYHGIVDSVASVPSSTGGFGNNVKEYEAVVRITDEAERVNKLRPGLTASLDILVERREDVLQIPMQASVTVGAKQFAFVVTGKKVDLKPIKVGKTNSNFIEILDGLSEGDQVVMNPHSHFKKEISDMEAEQAREQLKAATKGPEVIPPAKPNGASGEKKPGEASGPGGPGRPQGNAESGGRPAGRPGGEGNPSGPPSAGGPPGGGGGFDPMAFFDRMDKDQNGKVSKDEAEGRFAENFEKFDADNDGNVTKEEFQDYRAKNPFGGRGGGRPRAEAGGT
jgi:HlyD family secretion protein